MGGTPHAVVRTGVELPELSRDDAALLDDTWPYVAPTWLAANERAMPEIKPFHTVATRGRNEIAVLPAYVLTEPPAVDHDPRTYLGWQPPNGEQVCCGVDVSCDQAAEAAALGEEPFFPALLVGSPLGYRSEVAFNFYSPGLFGQMTKDAIDAALAAGIRSVVAPWIPDRRGNDAIVDAFRGRGGETGFWGFEDYVALTATDWDAHVAGLPTKKRQRIASDLRKAAASGVTIERRDGADLYDFIPTIADLTCRNREKNGAGEEPRHIATLLTGLLDAGVDVRGYLGRKDGAVVATCVVLRRGQRLFAKWAGFDYDAIGDRSGVYFAMVLDAPVRDAYAEHLQYVEFGAGAHEAKTLRGCLSRQVSTALLLADTDLRPTAHQLLAAWSSARRAAFGAAESRVPVPLPRATACCSGG